ncbi:MAG TPA: hypothetical protein VJU53_13985 [Burkholderiaceae bacterium]|nr:hypothetical protein [Burkholderiaceae bacterium]
MSKRWGTVLVFLCVSWLSGCASIVIVDPRGAQPSSPSPVSVPVSIEITKSVYGRSFVVTGGATPLLVSGFSTSIKPGTQNTEVLTTTLSLSPGSYTLTASGTYNQWNGQAQPISATSSFTVTASTPPLPTFTVNPAGPLVLRRNGGSANLSVTIAPAAGFSAPVTLSVPNPPPGITAGTTTIPAGMTTGQLALTATAGADYGDRTVTLRAVGGGVTVNPTFTLRVFHATGSFAKASFAVTTPPQSASSPNGAVLLTARVGTAEGLPSAYAAVFERQAGGVGRLGQPVPFNHGQSNVLNQPFGGAGFCAGSTAGFVIAGKGPGVVAPASAQYVASVLEFTNPSTVGTADVAAFRSTGTPYYFEPAIYFNSDCTLALAVGAHPIGPANNVSQVIDLKTGSVLNSFEFSTPSFTASVVDAGTRQRIEFTSGGQTQSANLP